MTGVIRAPWSFSVLLKSIRLPSSTIQTFHMLESVGYCMLRMNLSVGLLRGLEKFTFCEGRLGEGDGMLGSHYLHMMGQIFSFSHVV